MPKPKQTGDPLEKRSELNTKKAMLLAVKFTLETLGLDPEGLLGKFVMQEFQEWLKRTAEVQEGPKPSKRAKAA